MIGLGETDAYMERKRLRENSEGVGKTFIAEGKVALKRHWLILIYMVLLMAGKKHSLAKQALRNLGRSNLADPLLHRNELHVAW